MILFIAIIFHAAALKEVTNTFHGDIFNITAFLIYHARNSNSMDHAIIQVNANVTTLNIEAIEQSMGKSQL